MLRSHPLPARRRGRRDTVHGARTGAASLFIAAVLYGCAGDGPPPVSSSSAFDQIQTQIFNLNCLGGGCHNAQSQAGGLNLSAGASYAQLVNVQPQNPVAQSMGLLRVEPFDPSNSFLIVKLTGPGAGEGTRMPQGMNPLPASDIQMIQAWILDGAPAGGTVAPTASPTPSPTETATTEPTATETPSITVTPSATVTGSQPPTSTAADTPTITPTPPDTPSPSPTPTLSAFEVIQTRIFNVSCLDMFCHDTLGMSGGLVLEPGVSYANLVNVVPQNSTAMEMGLLRVDPFNSDNSFLVVKLVGPTAAEGLRMPSGKDPLPQDQIQLVIDWINAGAEP